MSQAQRCPSEAVMARERGHASHETGLVAGHALAARRPR
jgi:hypothetical protein